MVSVPMMTTAGGFTLGDVVHLKSGGPPLTVLAFEQAPVTVADPVPPVLIKCCGFRPDGGYIELTWPEHVLADSAAFVGSKPAGPPAEPAVPPTPASAPKS